MNSTRVQQIIEQLMYNQFYAPNYPAEDRTSLEKPGSINRRKARTSHYCPAKKEDVGRWLSLGHQSIRAAFENYRKGDESDARNCVELAIQYLRNAVARKN